MMVVRILTRGLLAVALVAVVLLGLRNADVLSLGGWHESIPSAVIVTAIVVGMIERVGKDKTPVSAIPDWRGLLTSGGCLVILAADQFYAFRTQELASMVGLAILAAGLVLTVAKAGYKLFRPNHTTD